MTDKLKFMAYQLEGEGEGDEVDDVLSLGIEKFHLVPNKKKLLVFDLNGLLIYRDHIVKKSSFPKDRFPDGVFGSQVVYKRPFLEEFMKFCLERFEVGIWSAAQVHNINGILESVLQEFKSRFLFVWNQEHCSNYGNRLPGNKRKPLFFKELNKLWSNLADDLIPDCQFSESITLLIDDDPYKALLNPPNTGIFLETYNVKDATDNALCLKNELGTFLEGLADAKDVPSYVKLHRIGQPAVGPAHPDWDFYSTIRDRFKNCRNEHYQETE